jgi:hypothetical protein
MVRATDPMPEPPVEPEPGDCCGAGCDPCVFDLHAEALERYRERLEAWRRRYATDAQVDAAAKRKPA